MEQFSSFVNKTTDEMLGVKGLEQENLNDMFHSYSPKSPTPTPTQINAGSVVYENGELYPNNTVGKALNDFYEDLDNKIDDVQINSVSIVADGVANIPIANGTLLGVVKRASSGYSVNIESDGTLKVVGSDNTEIKTPNANNARPILPSTQHVATFYGLAKAAGDTTQSQSDNSVGTYTDSAKSAILIMLGITDLIGNVEGATASQPYSIGDAFLHGGALYKATASIAANDAIVPGTNCEQTTLIDLMKGA